MFFARFFALFFLFASFSIVSSVPSKRQDTADIETVLNTLKSSTDTILPQISESFYRIEFREITNQCPSLATIGQSGNASDASVTPLINDLTTALSTASSSLTGLQTSSRKARRQSDDDIANLVAGIITDIANALDTLLGDVSSIPDLGSLLGGVDTALDEVLKGLETLLAGVLTLVANLLVDVAGLLESLSLGLTLASLGL